MGQGAPTCPGVVINLRDPDGYLDEVSVFRFRDGRIIHAWSLEDTCRGCAGSG
jgi:hypothetical protein